MVDADDFITLVIHTPERSQILKNILENHGIGVELEDFISFTSPVTIAQRVKILPKDLPLALKIIESGESYSPALIEMKMAGMSGNLLIPVDFSDSSKLAVSIGFKLAKRVGLHPVVMHSYVAPIFRSTSVIDFGNGALSADSEDSAIEMEESLNIRDKSAAKLAEFNKKIKVWQKEGSVPPIKYSTTLLEGVAEEVILEYTKNTPPSIIVMATRGIDKKGEDLVGSVTAEVLDSCRVPVFTVPEVCNIDKIEDVKRLMMFCNMDQHDIITIDVLMRMFDYPECEIILVPALQRKMSRVKDKMSAICEFFTNNFPTAKFKTFIPDVKNFRKEIDSAIPMYGIELLIVPNKKTNIFSRIFYPTMAHKFLFERDMPMLVLPV